VGYITRASAGSDNVQRATHIISGDRSQSLADAALPLRSNDPSRPAETKEAAIDDCARRQPRDPSIALEIGSLLY
jgi:hypothetical protein